MNITQDQIDRFKSDPKNLISETDPLFTIFIFFCVALLGSTLLEDIAKIQFPLGLKYPFGLIAAISAFAGRKMAWARIRRKETANKGLVRAGEPPLARPSAHP